VKATPYALAAIVLASGVLFMRAVGGPRNYFSHLDDTGTLTLGLTYFIWGVLVFKYAALAEVAERWRRGPLRPREWVLLFLALVAVGCFGARLLVIVALLQVAIVYAMTRSTRVPLPGGIAALAIVLVTFVGLGELRRWQSLPERPPFAEYLVDTGLPNLRITYVNQYADSVRLAIQTRELVPDQAGYEYGKELLRIALHPIPGGLRPSVEQAPELRAVFRTGVNGNALPLPVVGFIQFGFPGTVLFCFVLGLVAGLVDRGLKARPSVPAMLALVGAATGVAIVFRGSLDNAIAIAIMDVIGFFVVAALLGRWRSLRSA
jgi:hypothetical protein